MVAEYIAWIVDHKNTVVPFTMGLNSKFGYLFACLFRLVPARLGGSAGDLYTIPGLFTYLCFLHYLWMRVLWPCSD